MKVMVGCGIFFGFRGVKEHSFLRQCDWDIGVFGEGQAFPNRRFVGVGTLATDKKHKVSSHEAYLRDTADIMRIPILDMNDPNDFGASVIRYLEKLEPDQERMYCYPSKNPDILQSKHPYYKRKPSL